VTSESAPGPTGTRPDTAEHRRLAGSADAGSPWRRWGPYVSGRQWGTVREDYSGDGDAWSSFPFDHAVSRAYRWGEDGLGAVCDRYGFVNLGVALWNGQDPILKERLFGLTNAEGNHGEDAKEHWWALDCTPTHSWMQWLYRYPQAEYPYARLREENARRGRDEREFELADTGVLAENRFFDVLVSYAKAGPDDLCMTVTATNHGPDPAPLELIAQLWLRNTWSWGRDERRTRITPYPVAGPDGAPAGFTAVRLRHGFLGDLHLAAEGEPEVVFCENETNRLKLFGTGMNAARHSKDGINDHVVLGAPDAVSRRGGTKAGLRWSFDAVAPGASVTVRLRLSDTPPDATTFGPGFDATLTERRAEADAFYATVIHPGLSAEETHVARRAYAGLLWGKQLYRYDVEQWLEGDPAEPAPASARRQADARNAHWPHLSLADVISMPDEWEYPWFAAWDTAFHTIPLAHVDPDFAKEQLVLMCREWAMHPNGQLPAYEWDFGDVNPPVHAWAAWHVYRIDGYRDREFLIRIFTKLLLNFSWWVNRQDAAGSNLFEGGFLGMDNIGLFNRSAPLPPGFRLEQSDATSWMAFYAQQMFKIALELSRHDSAWDDTATKFLEHFLSIARAMSSFGSRNVSLWHEQDGFYYDVLVEPDGRAHPMRVRSMVGLLPLLAATEVPGWLEEECPGVGERLRWLQRRRPELVGPLLSRAAGRSGGEGPDGQGQRRLLSMVDPGRLRRILERLFDPAEFWSPHGIRSLSKAYTEPVSFEFDGRSTSIEYEPGESRTGMFGGNSNWRGPVWFPVNVLLADKLRTYGRHFGDAFTIEIPTGSGNRRTLVEAADLVDGGLTALFRQGPDGRRPSDGGRIESSADPLWREHPTFCEFFDGDTGEGLGATHQTGWTALVAHLLNPRLPPDPRRQGWS